MSLRRDGAEFENVRPPIGRELRTPRFCGGHYVDDAGEEIRALGERPPHGDASYLGPFRALGLDERVGTITPSRALGSAAARGLV